MITLLSAAKPYYSDGFTSDLRWFIFGVGCFVLASFFIFGIVAIISMWPSKSMERKNHKWSALPQLPQDHAVKITTTVPYDWEKDEFVVDWTEWEERLR